MMNEGFGKKWIDKILGKVDKDQGIANAGKVLGIGADGIVTPVEQTGGGTESKLTGTFTPSQFITHVTNGDIKVGDVLSFTSITRTIGTPSADVVILDANNNIKQLTNVSWPSVTKSTNYTCVVLSIINTGNAIVLNVNCIPQLIESSSSANINNESLVYSAINSSYVYRISFNIGSSNYGATVCFNNTACFDPSAKVANSTYATGGSVNVGDSGRSITVNP